MKVIRLTQIASLEEKSYRLPHFCASSIIIAGGRDVPHHTASEASPDTNPPPVMAAWINGEDGVGDIYTALSRDGGRTWCPPRQMRPLDQDAQYADVTLYAEDQFSYAFVGTASGCAFDDPFESASDGSAATSQSTLSGFVSSDLGETWQHLGLNVQYNGPVITGGRLLKCRGRYLLPVHSCGDDDGTQDRCQSVLISDDLINWRRGGMIPGTANGCLTDGHVTHPQPGEHEDGLILVMRDSGGPDDGTDPGRGHAQYSLSADCGDTWTPAAPYPEVPSHGSRGFFTTDSLGRYITVFNAAADCKTLKIRAKEPRGPWSPVRSFPSPGETNQNVDAVECAAGRYYTVFDSDSNTIVFADVEF